MKTNKPMQHGDVDYENAVEQLMLPEVQKEPLLPLYEAIHNAIHASQEINSQQIIVDIIVKRNNACPVKSIARITDFIITDSGIGFIDSKCFAFFKLFTADKKLKFNSRGVGRLAYFSSFYKVSIESTYEDDGLYYERKFPVSIATIGKRDLPEQKNAIVNTRKTIVHMTELKEAFFEKYYISPESIIGKLKEHFAPAILSSTEDIRLNITDNNATQTISKSSYNANKGKSFIWNDSTFNIYYIRNTQPTRGSHNTCFAAAGRVVETKNIKFLSNNKIGTKDEEKYYLNVYVTSPFLDKNVDTTRSRFLISIDDIESQVSHGIREHVEDAMPEILNANKSIIERIVEGLPHLSVVSDNNAILNNIPLYSNEQVIREALIQEYAKEQLASLNYVKAKSAQYKSQGVPNFENFLHTEKEKLAKGSRINHAHLVTYVMYREYILSLFSQFLNKNDDEKYSPEAILHNLIFPMKTSSTDCDADYINHNLWLVDDRYAAYSYLTSDLYEGTAAGKKREKNDKRYDIMAIYEDPVNGAAQNVFLIELKKTHKNLSETDDPVNQIIDYALRIDNKQLNKAQGGRINVTEHTHYYGLALCDIHNQYFTNIMIKKYSLKPRSDGKSYFTSQMNDRLFLEITNYENFLEIAKLRNKVFLEKLKHHL